jgi:3-deoxy-manno-octulosonate cytidylyltransferase (CMP-KDO synthetase)
LSGAAKIVGVIPARLESTRLERKALRQIAGHPMIAWVYRRAKQSGSLDRLLVATDSEEIRECCARYSIPSLMTAGAHRSGTDRLMEVMMREPGEIYVNIQGDEPMISAAHIELLLAPFRSHTETQVTTLKVAVPLEEAKNPNNVKVVTAAGADGIERALYFSRALIPFDRDGAGRIRYFKHLGLYAYRRDALESFARLGPSTLECAERLEQLRFLENGIPIVVAETPEDSIGVDEEADIVKVEELFRRAGTQFPE